MKRQILPLISLAVLLGVFALARPASSAAPKPTISPKVTIASIALLASGCGTEVNCVEVRWNVQSPPANPQVMSFEVSGRLTTQNGACPPANPVNISDHSARSAKLGFFQAGACTGQVRSADVTVKLFTRDIEGQKVLTSTANQSKTF